MSLTCLAWMPQTAAGLGSHLAAAALVTLLFAGAARVMRGVSRGGAVAGAAITFLLYLSAGLGGFAVLVAVFVLAYAATRLGYARKLGLGTAENKDGRSAAQVLANLGVGAAAAIVSRLRGGDPMFALAMVAAFAEAASDTVSSECGQASGDRARLLTTWERVPAGTNGGVSLAGTAAGALAAALVSLVGAAGRLIPFSWVAVATAAGVLGMLFDSLLGATLERRGLLDNDRVNFLGTLAAALLGLASAFLLRV